MPKPQNKPMGFSQTLDLNRLRSYTHAKQGSIRVILAIELYSHVFLKLGFYFQNLTNMINNKGVCSILKYRYIYNKKDSSKWLNQTT